MECCELGLDRKDQSNGMVWKRSIRGVVERNIGEVLELGL